MSEKIYRWLLRLYPSHFREAHGEEALDLFRDRSRDETGFFPRLRLWLDLVTDLAVSLPRIRRPTEPSLAVGGAPSFQVLDDESLRLGLWLLGAVLSLAAFGTGSFLIGHGGNHWPLSPTGGAGEEAVASGQPMPRDTNARVGATDQQAQLDAAERKRVIDATIANLNQYYVDPDLAEKMANALREHERDHAYDTVTNGEDFADLLNGQMWDVSHDMELRLGYSPNPFPTEPSPELIALIRRGLILSNCTLEKVEILAHNIGYLKLNSFPDPSVCQPRVSAAMAQLTNADAIIFDLRYNGGGSPKMVALIAAYLFDRPTHLNDFYNRAEDSTEQSWTSPPVPGNKLVEKPAYVLTARGTYAAAEEFSYDLQMLKRATIVGDTTGGGAHISKLYRIDEHFAIFVPVASAVNPVSKTNWQVAGVVPDVRVKSADALAAAETLAWNKLQKK